MDEDKAFLICQHVDFILWDDDMSGIQLLYCQEKGQCKRNSKMFLEEFQGDMGAMHLLFVQWGDITVHMCSDIHVIHINLFQDLHYGNVKTVHTSLS